MDTATINLQPVIMANTDARTANEVYKLNGVAMPVDGDYLTMTNNK